MSSDFYIPETGSTRPDARCRGTLEDESGFSDQNIERFLAFLRIRQPQAVLWPASPRRVVWAEQDTMRAVKIFASVVRRVALIGLLPVALGACVGETSTPRETSRRSPFQVDQPFPDLALPALEGSRPVSIRDYRGQKVILHVFASW